MAEEQISMMMSVLPGTMTGFAALNSGLVSINNAFLAMTTSFGREFGLMDTIIATTGVVVTQLGLDAMDAFGKFEQGMKIVQMVSGQTKSDIEQLSQAANQFSVQYRTDIDQITEGLQTLGRAGLNSASEQTEVLQNGLNTAKLEGRDLNGVLEELIQNTALLGGDLKSSEFGEDSQYINDLLVATSMTAPITTHDVSETLKYSGGIAAAAGANIRTDSGAVNEAGKAILEDYMGAIAAFAQKGVTGSIAGTALRAFFNKPATQDSSVTDALASIKLKPEYLWEDDEETMKPVSEQIKIITDQMDKLDVPTMDRLQIWSKIVGGKMGQQMMKLESDDIKNLTKDIQGADDATSLAANSMKTYEANLKALGESGAVLQRNVGRNLVYFANPVLELLTKIAEFGQQDFMSLPITFSILGFFTALVRRIKTAFSTIRSEFASLTSAFRTGEKFLMGKTGFVRKPDGSMVLQSVEESDSKSSSKSPTTFASFLKQYSQQSAANSPLGFQALQKAGLSNDRLAIAAHLSKLTKGIELNGVKVPEGQIWAAALKNNLLSDGQVDILRRAQLAGVAGRGTADLVGINNVLPQIKQCQQALNELGATAMQVSASTQAVVTEEDEKSTAQLFASESIEKTKQEITSEEIFREALNAEILETNEAIKAQVYEEGVIESTIRKIIKAEQDLAIQAEKARISFMELSAAVGNSAVWNGNIPNRMRRIGPTTSVSWLYGENPYNTFPAYVNPNMYLNHMDRETGFAGNVPYHFGWSRPPFGYGDTSTGTNIGDNAALRREFINSGLAKVYGWNLSDDEIAGHLAKHRIPGYDSFNEDLQRAHRENLKIYPDIGRDLHRAVPYGEVPPQFLHGYGPYYGPAPLPIPGGAGAGSVENIKENIRLEEENRPNEEAEQARKRNLVRQVRQESADADAASTKALQEHQEKVRRNNLSTVQYEEETLAVDRERLATEEQIAITARTRAESEGVASSGMYGKGVPQSEAERFRADVASGRYRTEDTLGKAGYSSKSSPSQVVSIKDSDRYPKPISVLRLDNESKNILTSFKKPFDPKAQSEKLYGNSITRVPTGQHAPEDMNATLAAYGMANSRMAQLQDRVSDLKNKVSGATSTFVTSASSYINRDRTGRLLNFAQLGPNGKFANSLGGLANKTLNATDAIGGPFMIVIMAVTAAIQMWQKAFQDYCEDLKEAGNQLKEAYSERNMAEDSLRQTFRDGNPDATDEEIDQMVYDTYGTMNQDMANAFNNGMSEWYSKIGTEATKQTEFEYDEEAADGTMKEKEEEELSKSEEYEKAVKENTGALYAATAELNVATSKYVTKALDGQWGVDGWTGAITDALGSAQDYFATLGEGSKFSDSNEFLLTASQKDENYAGYTGMAGLLLEDIKDSGTLEGGLKTMMGSDGADLLKTLPKETYDAMKGMEQNIVGLGAANNMRLQASMKNDQKTWKSLGKELAKRDSNKKANRDTTKNMQRISGLISKLNASMGGNFSETQILQAAYLAQMQDMLAVTQSAIVPIIQSNLQLASSTLLQASGIAGNTNGTGTNTFDTYATATVIAGLVAQIARATAADTAYNTALAGDPGTKEDGSDATDINNDGISDLTDRAIIELAQRGDIKSGQDFLKEASKLYSTNKAASESNSHLYFGNIDTGISIPGTGGANSLANDLTKDQRLQGAAPMLFYEMMYEAGAKMTSYGYNAEDALKMGWSEALKGWENGLSSNDVINTFAKNYTENPMFKQRIIDTYNAADEDGGSGSGGSGSGSGNKDNNDNGTRKERVDLVLCNRKTIPKLNVNLFKKPPSFTILNKNFKLRDVKINSEDKPKAIMAAIKNSFIDIQKRTDPKIIQDEDAVYDPAAATDGTNVPSGSAKTNTS